MSILSKNTTIGGHKPLLNDDALQTLIKSLGITGDASDEGVLAAAITKALNTKATDSSLGRVKLSSGNTNNNANSTGEVIGYKVINQTSINLDTFKTEGTYTIITPSISNCSNFPTKYISLGSKFGWHLTVWREWTDGYCMQIITREQQSDICIRYLSGSSWSSWMKIINTSNANSLVTKVNNKEVLTSYGNTIRTKQSNFNNCTTLGIGMCGVTNAPNSQCSEWGFINLPSSRSGSTNATNMIQIAWLCGNHSEYPTFYYRHYYGVSSSTSWGAWNPIGHLAS